MSCGTSLSSRHFHTMQTGHQQAYRQQFRSSCQQQLVGAAQAQRPTRCLFCPGTHWESSRIHKEQGKLCLLKLRTVEQMWRSHYCQKAFRWQECVGMHPISAVRHRTLGSNLKPKAGCPNTVRKAGLHVSTSLSVGCLSQCLCSCKHKGNCSLCHIRVNLLLSLICCSSVGDILFLFSPGDLGSELDGPNNFWSWN